MRFLKKKLSTGNSDSLSTQTWKRFKRNPLAMTGLCVIIVASVISVLGYLITPDKTPYANDQKLELFIKEPGFKVKFLFVFRNEEASNNNFFQKMLFGESDAYARYSISGYKFVGQNIVINEYTGNSTEKGPELSFNIADVIYPINTQLPMLYDSLRNKLSYTLISSQVQTTNTITELQNIIVQKNIRQKSFLLGTDLLGRDLLSRLMIGTRISLSVGLVSVIISLLIGIFLGSLAGYFRGKTDATVMWLLNVVWTIPTILLVISITLVLGKGIVQVFIAVGLTMWVEVARIVRGQVLSLREKEFVEAGRALGFTNGRIIFRHILPNVMGPVIVIAASNFASAILMEAGLSFLGIGAQPPIPSWGEMTNAHHGYILMDKAYLAFIPGAAIMILVLSFVLVGNGLRDALDTRATDARPIVNI